MTSKVEELVAIAKLDTILSYVPTTIGERFKEVVSTLPNRQIEDFINALYRAVTKQSVGFYYKMQPEETETTVTASIEALDLLEGWIVTTTLVERADVNGRTKWQIKRIKEVKEIEKVL